MGSVRPVWKGLVLAVLVLPGGAGAAVKMQAPASVFAQVVGQDAPLYVHGTAGRRPIASLTKMMTALVVRQHFGLDDTLTVPKGFKRPPGSTAGLVPGGTYTVRDLLAGLLVASGNDVSLLFEQKLKDKDIDPVAAMNQKAFALGLQQTRYGDLIGFGCDDGCGSTARDQWRVLSALREDTVLWHLLMQRGTMTLSPFGPAAQGKLLGKLGKIALPSSFLGGKTGYTRKAGECVAGAYWLGGKEVLVVVLGADDLETGLAWLDGQLGKTLGVPQNEKPQKDAFTPACNGVPVALAGHACLSKTR